MSGYDPFTYNPRLASFFMRPEQHQNAVTSFGRWLQKERPQIYQALLTKRPDLLNAARVIATGALGVTKETLKGLSEVNATRDGSDASYGGSASVEPATNWGTDLLDFVKTALPTYYQAKAQSQLLNINVARAEQGLPPIESSSLAPQVNVGMSKDAMMLGYVAIGGLVIVGLMSAFRNRR